MQRLMGARGTVEEGLKICKMTGDAESPNTGRFPANKGVKPIRSDQNTISPEEMMCLMSVIMATLMACR